MPTRQSIRRNNMRYLTTKFTLFLILIICCRCHGAETETADSLNIPGVSFKLTRNGRIEKNLLIGDTLDSEALWNNFAVSEPGKPKFDAAGTYRVEFDCVIIKKAVVSNGTGYFYFFMRTPKGTKFDKWFRWNGKDGAKLHKFFVFTLADQPGFRLRWGIKGKGKLNISSIKILKVDKNQKVKKIVEAKNENESSSSANGFVGFEKNEPIIWKLSGTKTVIQTSGDNRLLLADMRGDGGVWRNYLTLNFSKLGVGPSPAYSLQLDYDVIKGAGYFYVFTDGGRGRAFPLRWNAADGSHGKAEVVFAPKNAPLCRMTFGMKGAGAIKLDNIRVRKWKSLAEGEKALRAEKVDVKLVGSQVKSLTSRIRNSHPAAKWHADDLLFRARNLLDKQNLSVDDKLALVSLRKRLALLEFKLKISKTTDEDAEMLVFVDSPMRKLRRDAPYHYSGKSRSEVDLSCAGNESESFQVVVVPLSETLKEVALSFTDLSRGNKKISKRNIRWYKVGYVNTKKKLYPVKYAGWWPDPLTPDEKSDIGNDVYLQPFWVTVTVPPDTAPGEYQGEIKITSANAPCKTLRFNLKVRGFTLPKRSYLKSSFAARDTPSSYVKWGYAKKDDPRLKNLDMLYRDSLLRHRLSPARIAEKKPKLIKTASGDYKIDFTEFEKALDHYAPLGLNSFTFGGYWGWRLKKTQNFTIWNETEDNSRIVTLKVLGTEYKKLMRDYFKNWAEFLKSKGFLDDVYCYIYDEPSRKEKKFVEDLMAVLHSASPRLKTIIPGIPSRGDKVDDFPYLDIMCPLTSSYDRQLAEQLKKRGRKSWWYVCISPKHPYPNFFIDYPAIDHRILFWMAWKYGIEGMLYWQTTFWRRVDPWKDSETFSTVHGDGCLFYPSKTFPIKVVPTIRLENIRDGVEDYDYHAILRENLALLQKKGVAIPPKLREECEELLDIPDDIVETLTKYTKSPEKLRARRERLGEAIDKLVELRRSALNEPVKR